MPRTGPENRLHTIATPHPERLRLSDHHWNAAVEALFDADDIYYCRALEREGFPGAVASAMERYEPPCRALLEVMELARPEEAALVRERWEAFWAELVARYRS